MPLTRDWMTKAPLVTVEPDATLGDVVARMAKHGVRELPIVEDGALVGIITDRDVKMALGPDARGMDLDALDPRLLGGTVEWFMTEDVETVRSDLPLRKAAELLAELRVGALPVVDDGDLVGILSVTDVLRAAARHLRA